MIYAASLAIVAKKALGDKCFQTSINKIIETLPIDAEVSNMDAIIIGPRDTVGPTGIKLQNAIDRAHSSVCVIYIYTKDKERDLVNCKYKKAVKKITEAVITEAQEEFLGDHIIKIGKQSINYKDLEANTITSKSEIPVEEVVEEPVPEVEVPELQVPEVEPPVVEPEPEPEPETKPISHIEDTLKSITNYKDWNLFMEQMNKDNITRKLIEENTEYVGLIQMLEVLDKQIEAVWRDTALSPEKKFEKIKEIGLSRSNLRGKSNSINVNKVLSIIETVCLSAKRTVDEKLSSVNEAMIKITTDKNAIMDTSKVDKVIEERTAIQLELMEIMRGVIDLYKSMDLLVTEEIKDLSDRLPSDNMFVNEMVKPIGTDIFTPENTGELATKLMQALQENRLTMSQLEASIKNVIGLIFQLCEKDNEIIQYQQNLINLLKANRIEDIVLRDSLLKNVLRLYTGSDDTGRSATAITWAGINSRSQNSLLIDITGRDKFADYGIEAHTLEEFFEKNIEDHFVCVRSRKLDAEELQEMVSKLKGFLNYYPYINIIVAPEDSNTIEQLSVDALTIHYITDCTTRSINQMKEVIANNEVKNIAHKLIMIDAPVNPLMIADMLEIDPTITKLVTLPNVNEIKACAIKHDKPYEYSSVVRIYEEAFK